MYVGGTTGEFGGSRGAGDDAVVARIDALTGFPDRQAFLASLERGLDVADALVAVLVVDLDHFKFVNDTVGHGAGDALLVTAAGRLRAHSPSDVFVARLGGDEFALWIPVERLAGAISLAEQLRSTLDEPFDVDGLQHFVSASIGVVVSAEECDPQALLAEADTAMCAAKAAGGNGYAVFDEALRDQMTERAQALRDLNQAISHREIELDVQPIIDLRDGTRAYEVLARWNHPTRGRLSPAAFIGLAEESGLIGRLGHQILELGASHAAALDARISVNVSVRQFNRTLTQQVAALIERYQLAPGQLIIEITESAVIDNEQAQAILNGLRSVGADIWIDDFGTGYSSLSRLTALSVDGLKLPREFIEDLDSAQGWGIAAAIVGIARALDIDVIAEGVETRHQLAQLKRLGCDAAQGYLLGRPRPFLQEQQAFLAGETHIASPGLSLVIDDDQPAPAGSPLADAAEAPSAPTHIEPAADVGLAALVIQHVGNALPTTAPSLWESLPLGLLVVDLEGTIQFANGRAADMAGRDRDDVVGRSLFDFIDTGDVDFIVAALARGTDFTDNVLGPFRLRFRHRDGSLQWSEYWAYETPAELGFAGYVVTMAHESTGDVLAAASRDIAVGADLETTLQKVADSMRAHPMSASGVVLTVDDGAIATTIGPWPYPGTAALRDLKAPWTATARGGGDRSMPVAELPTHLRADAVEAGFASLSIRSIDLAGERRAVLLAWHRNATTPSPNQERHLDEAVATATLAFDHDDHRRVLRHAALHDHLTGAGNRAKFELDATAMLASIALYVDLDDFKTVNDRHGHVIGDMVLRTAAARLEEATVGRAQVYRIGGDEFAVMFEARPDRVATAADADAAAHEVVAALRAPYPVAQDIDVAMSASVGVAVAGPGERADHLLSRADEALLRAKRAGKARHQQALELFAV